MLRRELFVIDFLIKLLAVVSASNNAGKIIVVGGYTADGNTNSAEMFDFESATWRGAEPFPLSIRGVEVAYLGGQLYAIGGRYYTGNELTTAFSYDPLVNTTWTRIADMGTARAYAGVVAISGKIVVIGGLSGGGESHALSSVEAFDPATMAWTPLTNMATARGELSVGILDGEIYAVGGANGDGVLVSVERYNLKENKWHSVASMGTARTEHCVAVLDGRLYAIGGRNGNGDPIRTAEAYDPNEGAWKNVANMSAVRYGAGAVAMNGRIYVVGGRRLLQGDFLNFFEVYEPETNSWSVLDAPMTTARLYFGVALFGSRASCTYYCSAWVTLLVIFVLRIGLVTEP